MFTNSQKDYYKYKQRKLRSLSSNQTPTGKQSQRSKQNSITNRSSLNKTMQSFDQQQQQQQQQYLKKTPKINQNLQFEELTEEAIDDWIAQSQNRTIMSFLDPHKQFNAPASLVGQFKNRYKSWMKNKDKEIEMKMQYFDNKQNYIKKNNIYQRAQLLKEQKNRQLVPPLDKLQPKMILGTPISKREEQFLEQQKQKQQQMMLSRQQSSQKKHRKLKTSPILRGLENYVLVDQNNDNIVENKNQQNNSNKNTKRQINIENDQIQINKNQSQNTTLNSQPRLDSQRKQNQHQSTKPQEYNWEKERLLKKEINYQIDKLLEEDLEKPANLTEYNKLDQHPQEITTVEKDKNNLDNVDFSFYRGTRRMQSGNYELAIQNFKQTLNIDRFHFPSVYNLGCCYERIRKYETAKKWLNVAQHFPLFFCENYLDDIQFGQAICYYKTQDFVDSLNLVEELADEQEEIQEDKKHEYLYLRCLCEKKQQKFDKVQSHYKSFIHFTSPKNFVMLMHLMFAIVFKNLRGLEIKLDPLTSCSFNTVVHQILASKVTEEIFSSVYDSVLQQWKIKQSKVISQLQQLNFFKRFDNKQLNNFYPYFNLLKMQKTQVIFPKKEEVFIIVAGHVAVYNHQKNFRQPDIVAYFTQGDIIGCDDKDNKLSQLPDIWFVSLTNVELISMPREQFIQLWKCQQSVQEKAQIYDIIKKNPIFQGVSELTLHTLAYELFQNVNHVKGDIIYNDNECQEKYTYIQLVKEKGQTIKNFKNRLNKKLDLFDYYHKKMDGFYIILKGEVECETPGHSLKNQQEFKQKVLKKEANYNIESNWINNSSVLTLTNDKQDYFGENLLFNSIGLSRFGRLKAKSSRVSTLMLSKNHFYRLNLLDIEIMKNNARNRDYFKQCQNLLYKYYKSQKLGDD